MIELEQAIVEFSFFTQPTPELLYPVWIDIKEVKKGWAKPYMEEKVLKQFLNDIENLKEKLADGTEYPEKEVNIFPVETEQGDTLWDVSGYYLWDLRYTKEDYLTIIKDPAKCKMVTKKDDYVCERHCPVGPPFMCEGHDLPAIRLEAINSYVKIFGKDTDLMEVLI